MSVVYLVALIAVCMTLLGALAEAVWSVSRKPAWSEPLRALRPVITTERRTLALPYVGIDRRTPAMESRSEFDKLAA